MSGPNPLIHRLQRWDPSDLPISHSEAEAEKHGIGAPCDPDLSFWKDGTVFSLFGRHHSVTGKWAINNE